MEPVNTNPSSGRVSPVCRSVIIRSMGNPSAVSERTLSTTRSPFDQSRGNAGFMVAVLLTGLKDYYDLTGDERVKQSIIRGAHYLLDECYSDEVKGFRYTSCPKTSYRPGATPLMVEGIARAYLWTKDKRFRRVLTEALPLSAHGSSYGKGFSMYYRCGPRVLADLAAAGLTLNPAKGAD